MADPIVTPTVSALAGGLLSGLVGAVLAGLGISSALLVFGVMGAVVGLSWAPASGRVRAVALFGCASVLSAKAGALALVYGHVSSVDGAQGVAALAGIVFHPAMVLLIEHLPEWLGRRGGRSA